MLRRAVAYSSDNFTYRLALATMSRNLGMFGEASDEYENCMESASLMPMDDSRAS